MESLEVPVMALRINDRMKVGMERYEKITGIDHRHRGTVKVRVSSGIVYEFGYHETVIVSAANPTRRRPLSHRLGARQTSTSRKPIAGSLMNRRASDPT